MLILTKRHSTIPLLVPFSGHASCVAEITVDLTFTEKETAHGSTTFSLSGASGVTNGIPFTGTLVTNFREPKGAIALPPAISPGLFYSLPVGLTLNGSGDEVFPIVPLFAPDPYWFPATTSPVDSMITSNSGSGSVRIREFPFFTITPGTFRVDAAPPLIDTADEDHGELNSL